MPENKSKAKRSIIGKGFYCFDVFLCENIKIFIKRHEKSVEVIFLLIYVILQILLVQQKVSISIFIIWLLFFLSFERILVHLKAQLDKETLEKKQKEISEKVQEVKDKMIKKEKEEFELKNRLLREQRDFLISELEKRNRKSNR